MGRVLIFVLIMMIFSVRNAYADPLLDSATQLIPQDPNHPVSPLPVTPLPVIKPIAKPQVKSDSTPQIIAKNANGETQNTVIDQEGRWIVLQNNK